MALQKLIENSSNFSMEYWKIIKLFIYVDERKILIELAPYKDQESRIDGATYSRSDVKSYEIRDYNYDDIEGYENLSELDYTKFFNPDLIERKGLYTCAYDFIKTQIPEFKDSIDI